jgi:hypothetical protein
MCTTISQLWEKNKKLSKKNKEQLKRLGLNKFYTFKEFVTLHNQGKLDSYYYMGDTVCPKSTPVVESTPVVDNTAVVDVSPACKTDYNSLKLAIACFIVGGLLIGMGASKKE